MKEPLKFCMVTTFYPPYSFGGDAMHIYRLSNELAARGHEVDVFHCADSFLLLNGKPPTGFFPNHERVRVFTLKSRAGFLSPLLTQQTGIPFLKSDLKRALEENDYDVIHYHNMSLIGINALTYGNAVKLYTTHEHWLICPMHVLWKFDREVCRSKSCLSCQIKGKRPPQWWRYAGLFERTLGEIDCFLSPSEFTLRKHLESGLDIPIRHLPYFLPTPKKENRAPEEQPERPFFLFVGRLERIKGVQNLIPAFENKPRYDLLIAGDGEYRNELEAQAQNMPNVKFTGRLAPSELERLYRSAVAVIVPSICYETFGIIIIEAFAQKTPVIVNDLGALPEVVEKSGGGLVYKNPRELIDAMEFLAGDAARRDDYGARGHAAFLRYWNEEAHLAEYLSLVEELREAKSTERGAIKQTLPDTARVIEASISSR